MWTLLCLISILIFNECESTFIIPPNLPGPRIVGGYEADAKLTKYQVSVRIKEIENEMGFGWGLYCGGSLIAPDIVLTAAHCVVDMDAIEVEGVIRVMPAEQFVVVMGTLYNFNKTSTTVVRNVKRIAMHDIIFDDDLGSLGNDVALLLLEQSIPLSDVIGTIGLKRVWPTIGSSCRVSGWGATKDSVVSNRLLALTVPLLDTQECNGTSSYNGRVLVGSICAGFMVGGKDSCQGRLTFKIIRSKTGFFKYFR